MNYGELKTEVANISHRSVSTDLPKWIELLEGTFARNLRATDMLKMIALEETDRDSSWAELYDLPVDFLEERIIKISSFGSSGGRRLEKVGLDTLYTYKRSTRVWGYALTGSDNAPQVAFIGTPATDSLFDVMYFARQTLDTDNDSNTTELLTNHAELYVHGCLFYVYQKSQDLELAQAHADQLDEAMKTLNEQTGRFLGGTVANTAYNLGVHSQQRGY